MSAPSIAGKRSLRIRGVSYPVILPSWRDPRLHLASIFVTLHIIGQVEFNFRLSIPQILAAVLTCALLEVGITFWQKRVILWPASAMLTGNGIAFILRVPGTQHGDWWSFHGVWIYIAVAAVSLLSKYLIRFRGRHIFNPSNFGLVLCFLRARQQPNRAARVLVGPDVAVARAGAGDHRGRRARDPLAAEPAGRRGALLGHVRGRHRRARR